MFTSKVPSKLHLITYNFQPDAESLISFIFPADSPCQKHTLYILCTSLNRCTGLWLITKKNPELVSPKFHEISGVLQ